MNQTPETTQSPKTKGRNETVDVIRLIAAIGIVYVHAIRSPSLDSSRNLFRFAVPFYLFASVYFQSLSLRRGTEGGLGAYVRKRVKRLYLPFLAWSVIYLAARDVKRIFSSHSGLAKMDVGQLWRGTEYHLWFLPFLLAGSILLAVIHWTTLRHDRRCRWPLIVLAIAGGLVFAYVRIPSNWDQNFDSSTYGYVQNWRAMPALCWALAFAWFMTMGLNVYSVSRAAGLGGVALTVFCSVKQLEQGILLIPRALSGLGCQLAAMAPWNGWWIPTLARFGRYSYGIYLCHVLIGEFVRTATSHRHLQDSAGVDILVFVASLVGSFFVVLTLARSRFTAWLNG